MTERVLSARELNRATLARQLLLERGVYPWHGRVREPLEAETRRLTAWLGQDRETGV